MADPNVFAPPTQDDESVYNPFPVSEPTMLDRVLAQRSQTMQKVAEDGVAARSMLARQRQQHIRQDANLFGSLGTDSDVARAVVGGVAKGVGAMVEGTGYVLGAASNGDPSGLFGGIEKVGEAIGGYGERTQGDYNVGTQQAIADSTPRGSITDLANADFGAAPSMKGYSFQMLQILGEFAPQAVGLLQKGAAGVVLSGLAGASQAGVSQGNESKKFIMGMDEGTLWKNSDLYKELRTENASMSHEEAKRQTAESAKAASFITGAVVGGAGGVATNYILKPMQGVLSGGKLAKIASTTAISAVEEGSQEVAETVLSRAAANAAAGTDRDITADTFSDLVLGAGFGAGLGGAGAAAASTAEVVGDKIQEATDARVKSGQESLNVSQAVAEGDLDSLTDPEKREDYPAVKSAKALAYVINDAQATPEAKTQATAALNTIANEVAEEAAVLQAIVADPKAHFEGAIEEQNKIIGLRKVIIAKPDTTPETAADMEAGIKEAEQLIEVMKREQENFDPDSFKKNIKSKETQLKEIEGLKVGTTLSAGTEQGVSSPESSDTLVNTASAPDTTPEARTAAVRELAMRNATDPTSVSLDVLEGLASNPQTPPEAVEILRQLSATRQVENAVKDMGAVKGNIFSDNASTGYASIQNYRSQIGNAMRSGDIEGAQRSLKTLGSFAKDHTLKAQMTQQAMATVLAGGPQQAVLADRTPGNPRWAVKPLSLVNAVNVRKNGGLTISTGSRDLVESIQMEAQVLQETHEMLSALVSNPEFPSPATPTRRPGRIQRTIEALESEAGVAAQSTAEAEPVATPTPVAETAPENVPEAPAVDTAAAKSAVEALNALQEITENGGTIDQLISWARGQGNSVQSEILNKYSELASIASLKVSNITDGATSGMYFSEAETIGIDVNKLTGTAEERLNFVVEVIIHEGTHAISFKRIERDPEFKQAIVDLQKRMVAWKERNKDKLTGTALKDFDYATDLTDEARGPHELLSTVMGSAELQKVLAQIPTQGDSNSLRDFLKAIVTAISKILPLSSVESNALSDILSLVNTAIDGNAYADVGENTDVRADAALTQQADATPSTQLTQKEVNKIIEDISWWMESIDNHAKLEDPDNLADAMVDEYSFLQSIANNPYLQSTLEQISFNGKMDSKDPSRPQVSGTMLDRIKTALPKSNVVEQFSKEEIEDTLNKSKQADKFIAELPNEGMSADKAINMVLSASTDPSVIAILEKYAKIPEIQALASVSSTRPKATRPLAGGEYIHLENRVGLYPDRWNAIIDRSNWEIVEHFLIHELTHVYTYDAIENDAVLRAQVQEIQRQLRKWLSNVDNKNSLDSTTAFYLDYAVSDPQELLTEALGSPDVRAVLAKIPYVSTGSFASPKTTLLGEFGKAIIGFVEKTLGLNVAEGSLLERVFNLSAQAEAYNTKKRTNTDVSEETVQELTSEEREVPAQAQPEASEAPVTIEETNEQVLNDPEPFINEEGFAEFNEIPDFNDDQDFFPGAEFDQFMEQEVESIANPNEEADAVSQEEAARQAEELAARIEGEAAALERELAGLEMLEEPASMFSFQSDDTFGEVVGPLSADEINRGNKLSMYFNNSGKTVLGKYKNFFDVVVRRAAFKPEVLTPYLNGGDARLNKFLSKTDPYGYFKSLSRHREEWSARMDEINRPQDESAKDYLYRWQTPMDYFLNQETGMIDQVVKDAISVVAFDFMAKTGNSLWYNNTDRSIRSILNLSDTDIIPSDARKKVEQMGRRQNSVVNELGGNIYATLGLKANKGTPVNEVERVKSALGSMAMMILVDAGYLQRPKLKGTELDNEAIALVAKFNRGEKLTQEEQAYMAKEEKTEHFFLRSNREKGITSNVWEDNPTLSELSGVAKGSGSLINDLFGVPRKNSLPTTEKNSFKVQKLAKNSSRKVPENQRAMVDAMNRMPYRLNSRLVNPDPNNRGILDRLPSGIVLKMAGFVDTSETPTHVEHEVGVQGKNASIMREWDTLMNQHVPDVLGNDVSKSFYMPHSVKKQQRIHNDSTGFNPQSSKLHRALMSVGNWSYTVDTSKPDSKEMQAFKMSIIEAFGEATDAGTLETVLQEFDSILNDPKLQAALPVAMEMVRDSRYEPTPDELQDLLAATQMGGENMHTFAGLMALADYQLAKSGTGTFTATLMREGDGKTNGPMLALMQLGMTGTVTDAQMMAMGGFYTMNSRFNNFGEYAEETKMDLYKLVARDALKRFNLSASDEEGKTRAALVTAVMGNLEETMRKGGEGDEGQTVVGVSAKGRKLSKGPVTQVLYGAGVDKTVDNQGEEFVDSFYGFLENNHGKPAAITPVIQLINQMLGPKHRIKINVKGQYLDMVLTDIQKEVVKGAMTETFGEGIKEALDKNFARITEVRNGMNLLNNMSTRMYANVWEARKKQILDASYKAAQEAKGDIPLHPVRYQTVIENGKSKSVPIRYRYELTADETKALEAELNHMFPAVHTPLSLEAGDIDAGMSLANTETVEGADSGGVMGKANFQNLSASDGVSDYSVKQNQFKGNLQKFVDVGVGGVVSNTQATDASIAAYGSSKHNGLNVHDANITGAMLLDDVMKTYNKRTYEVLSNFSQPQAMLDNFFKVQAAYEAMKGDLMGDPEFRRNDELISSVRRDNDGKPMKNRQSPYEAALPILYTAAQAHKNKLFMLSRMKVVDQYYSENGAYKVTEAERAEAARRHKEEDLVDLVLKKAKAFVTEQEQAAAKAEADNTIQGLAAPPQSSGVGPGNAALNYTTREVFSALNSLSPMTLSKGQRVLGLLENLTEKVYGPLGINASLVQSTLGETPVQISARNQAAGLYALSDATIASGIKLTPAEAFAMEQIEMTIRDTLDGSSNTDKEIVRVFKDTRARMNGDGREFHQGDWSLATPAEQAAAKAIHDFIFRVDTGAGGTGSNHLSRFAALAMVYDPLSQALKYGINTDVNVDLNAKAGEIIEKSFQSILQKISNHVNGIQTGQLADSRLDALVQKLVTNEHKRKLEMNRKQSKMMEQLEDAAGAVSDGVRDAVVAVGNSSVFTNSSHKTVKAIGKVTTLIAEDRVGEIFKLLEENRNYMIRNKRLGFMMSTLNEVRGATTETQKLYTLLAEANKIEQERKNLKDGLREEVLSRFQDGEFMSDSEKAAVTQVFLRSDLAALSSDYTIDQIMEFVTDGAARKAEIQRITDHVKTEGQFASEYLKAAHHLGYFMATGKNTSQHLFRNVHTMAYQMGTPNMLLVDGAKAESIKPALDHLTSLLALDYTGSVDMNSIRSVIGREAGRGNQNALSYILSMHKRLKDEAQRDLFDGNPTQMSKGYTREIYDPYQTVVAATQAEGRKLLREGYVFMHNLPKDLNDPDTGNAKGLYVLKGIGMQSRETGMLSFTGMNAKGSGIHGSNTLTTPQAVKNWRKGRVQSVLSEKTRALNAQRPFYNGYTAAGWPEGQLTPVFAQNGAVANYQYLMDHTSKDAVLRRDNDFATILGTIASNQYDKTASAVQNRNVVTSLHEFFRDNYISDPNAYVEVSAESPDPDMRDAYRLLPESTRAAIRQVWGSDKMMVRNDVLDMVTGYRNLSLADPFGIDPNSRNVAQAALVYMVGGILGDKAATRVRKAEDMWKETVKLIKDIVVIRNLWTMVGNISSNTSTLIWHGVPLKQIVKGHKEAIDGLNRYQKDVHQLVKLKNRVGTTGSQSAEDALGLEIKETEFNMNRNPVHALVEAGLFQTIAEDVDVEASTGPFKNSFDTLVDSQLDRLPGVVRKAGNIAMVGKDTTMYRLLAKGTQMSDFVGRYVLYQHMTSGPNRKAHDDAVAELREVFVNYDIPTHRYLQYTNLVGLTMFTKYYIRTQKIIFGLMRSNPARGLGLAITENYFSNLSTIMDSNILKKGIGNPVDAGAFGIVDALDEPIPINLLFDMFR